MSGRFDVFHALDPEKQKRIIETALIEFAEKGFKRASTNEIAKKAEIGKGMLFYYFGSKEELFDFLCEYTIEFAKTTYLARLKPDTGDFIKRCQKLMEAKRQVMEEYRLPFAFFESFYKEENKEYFEKYSKDTEAIRDQIIKSTYEDIDYSLLRSDVDGKKVIQYIQWLIDAYQSDLTKRFKCGEVNTCDEGVIKAEWKQLADFYIDLRKLFYKEGK